MERKSLTSSGTTVSIILPRIRADFDPFTNIHTWVISWGDAEKKLSWTNDFFRYNPASVADSLNETLKELCAESKPYSLTHPT